MALVSVKMGLKTAHAQSGLRSFDKTMQEEINRLITDHISDLLFAPTQSAILNLNNENLAARLFLSGDEMYDLILWESSRNRSIDNSISYRFLNLFYLVTIHRPEKRDYRLRLQELVKALMNLDYPSVLAAHPKLLKQLKAFNIQIEHDRLIVVNILNHSGIPAIAQRSQGVITDSGGLREEAYLLGIKCTTLRNSTEWPETLQGGWNVLTPDVSHLIEAVPRVIPREKPLHLYDAGNAARVILQNFWELQLEPS